MKRKFTKYPSSYVRADSIWEHLRYFPDYSKYTTSDMLNGDLGMRSYLAQHTDCSDVLRKLANDKNSSVRFWVAQNLHTPPEVLDYLIDDGQSIYAVLGNPNVSTETLTRIANTLTDTTRGCRDYCVAPLIARHPNTPHEVVEELRAKGFNI